MESFIDWVEKVFATKNAEGIIAISAIIAWLLPKLIGFFLKFLFNTLLFIANVLGRDKVELWLKSKINKALANFIEGAKVDDIPRWLNKDQLALHELHWENGPLIVDVPSVIVTINLPTFGYNVIKLKLRYLMQKTAFSVKFRELLHNSVREVRIQEPAIYYNVLERRIPDADPPTQTDKPSRHKGNIFSAYQEAVNFHLHIIVEHGQLKVTAFGFQAALQNLNVDIYNRVSTMDKDQNGYLLSFLLTALYDGSNVSLCNKVDSLTEYMLVVDHIFITQDMWQELSKHCQGLQEFQFANQNVIGKLKYIRMELSLEEQLRIKYLDCEYRINKPHIQSWLNFESPASFEGRLGWDEHGLQLLDNFLLFQNGLRLHVPCMWQNGKLVLELPGLDTIKKQYSHIVENAKENVQNYKSKLEQKIKSGYTYATKSMRKI